MRRSILVLCYFLFVSVMGCTNVFSQSGEDLFWQQVERVGRDLNSLWSKEINDGANLVIKPADQLLGFYFGAPGKSGELQEICEIMPQANQKDSSIRFNRRELIGLSFATSYALLAYLVGSEVAVSPEFLDKHMIKKVRPFFRKLINDCYKAGNEKVAYEWKDLGPLVIYHGLPRAVVTRDVKHVADQSGQSFKNRNLHHYVAAYPILFLILHEAGHLVKGFGTAPNTPAEFSADQFAVASFHASKVPATFGIPFLQIFAQRNREPDLNCRLAKIAEMDNTDLGRFNEMKPAEINRLEALRAYYAAKYSKYCK